MHFEANPFGFLTPGCGPLKYKRGKPPQQGPERIKVQFALCFDKRVAAAARLNCVFYCQSLLWEGTECRLLWFYRSERCRRPPLPQATPAAVAEMDSYWSCGVFACDSTLVKGLCCIFVCYGALGAEWLLPCHSTIRWTLNLQLSAALGAMQQAPL